MSEYDGVGDLIAHYNYALGLISRANAAGNSAYYTFDALGNVQQLVTTVGGVANSYAYEPFGSLLKSTETIANPFQYVGQFGVMANGNGLDFMRARYYASSAISRFVSCDPIELADALNLYAYARNNPTLNVDPLGLYSLHDLLRNISRSASITGAVGGVAALATLPAAVTGVGAAVPISLAEITVALTCISTAADFVDISLYSEDQARDYWNLEVDFAEGLAGDGAMKAIIDFDYAITSEVTDLKWGDLLSDLLNALTLLLRDLVGASDPNQKLGPGGFGESAFISNDSLFAYHIDFENEASATAPAQQVTVTDQLDSDLDRSTFELTEIGFGDQLISVPAGSQHFQTTAPMTYNGVDFEVQIEAGIDSTTGQVYATFYSVDPATGLPPAVNVGFLPPEDGTGRGKGWFSYVIQPKADSPTGTQIRNVADISFDMQPIISTDQKDPHDPSQGTNPNKECLNTIDAGTPTSTVVPLPVQTTSAEFTVSWSGQDDAGGSGIASYNVYVSDNGADYALWQDSTTDTSAIFTGQNGHTYAFYSVARDNVGHEEGPLAVPDAVTTLTLDTVAPVVTVNPLATTDARPALTGTVDDPSATVEVTILNHTYAATNNGDGTWTLPDNTIDPVLSVGTYDVIVHATDGAGNTGADATTGELTVYVLGDMNWDGIVSIVGDVLPFVRVVYFGDYDWYQQQFPGKNPVLPGNFNGDGVLSIIGDMPGFVDYVYFGRTPVHDTIGPVFAQFPGTIDTADSFTPADITIGPGNFALNRLGTVGLGFRLRATGDGNFDPDIVEILDSQGQPIPPLYTRADLPGLKDSLTLCELAYGQYQLRIRGQGGSTGSYCLDAFLIGDADGDRNVDGSDTLLLQSAYGSQAGDSRYVTGADADGDGVISSFDLAQQIRNFGVVTTLTPLHLTAELTPAPPSETSEGVPLTDQPSITVVGQTNSGLTVALDTDGDGYDDGTVTAASTGAYAFSPFTLSEGTNNITVRAFDGFGQLRGVPLTVVLQLSLHG